MSEQDVHEIQLNGKQLVFMFMAVTVVSVVIFLCGVMVGRGVRYPLQTLALGSDTQVDAAAALDTPGTPPAPLTDTTSKTSPEPLTYAEQLESAGPDRPVKRSAPVTSPPVAPPVVVNEPPPPAPAKAPAAQDAPREPVQSASLAEPPGNGYVVQVKAFSKRPDADALSGRLRAKGYNAFVTENPRAVRDKYRVRVGNYPTRPEADAIAARLKQQEQFDPWVTH